MSSESSMRLVRPHVEQALCLPEAAGDIMASLIDAPMI